MKIIIPVDFSGNSLNALDFAVAIAGKKDGEIILVHVIEMVYDFASQASLAMDNLYKDAESQMAETLKKHQDEDLKISSVIKEGTASISIVRIARDLGASLIVMGTQGLSGIKAALIGSTTINVIKESSIPVLVVPTEANAGEIKKIALALEFANHEEKFIDWVIAMSQRWGRGLEFVHVQTSLDLKETPGVHKLEDFLTTNHPGLPVKIHTFYATTPVEGLDQFLEENEHVILVMCHEHKNLWDQILSRSQTIKMVFHSKVPLLVMV
ncbi:universal stress protein [Algoriphagus sp. AGSA1]|uniref:universal stress protein n=1 Tax=Algoriphagus sp. AGSA1 TaxID=2907213 RepID=UPI001F37CEF8|nr:universal stress protein [Algoriphagus sp. AGSA1]MCE7053827.1 universal stress protein [Algoriphagus sp. AGSA1]